MTTSTFSAIKDVVSSLFLTELFKGMALTGRHFLSKNVTVQFPEEKTPLSPRFSPWYSKWCVSTMLSTGQLSSQKPQKMHFVRSMS